jgi:benzil reductase ((S)-benzoin forming)
MKAIVTGHSRGLGAAIAENLLARGIAVLGLSRAMNAELGGRFPALLEQQALDLSDTLALAQWLSGPVLQRFLGGADAIVLVNNAATVQPMGAIDTQDIAAIARAVSLNVAAPLMLAAAVAAVGGAAADRRILHVSSGAGREAYPGWGIYCATKAALDHHARAAALDQTGGLRICSVRPGVIDTDMQAELRASPPDIFPIRERFEVLKREGNLSAPAQCAQRLMDYLLNARFGETAIANL